MSRERLSTVMLWVGVERYREVWWGRSPKSAGCHVPATDNLEMVGEKQRESPTVELCRSTAQVIDEGNS